MLYMKVYCPQRETGMVVFTYRIEKLEWLFLHTGCSVMYFAGFSEQRQRKKRKLEREKVNIKET